MVMATVIPSAQEYLQAQNISGWLLYDFRGMNSIFRETIGIIPNVTRPCWLWIPAIGEPRILASYVDQGRFIKFGIATTLFVNRTEMITKLHDILEGVTCVAMEYSPRGGLPAASKVDGGTLEQVRSLGVRVVSSADIFQYATQRWSDHQLQSHLTASHKLTAIVKEAFGYIGENVGSGTTEYDVAQFIRRRLVQEGLLVTDGPVVAVNEHTSDPHFDPTFDTARQIRKGDWVLIDLWSRLAGENTMFSDITWTAYVGLHVPDEHQRVFDVVVSARDAAVREMEHAFESGKMAAGWQIDKVARDYINKTEYGAFFNHRLGHNIGREVHGNGVNLDSWETFDTRLLIPRLAVSVEPGIYLPKFGVRSEIDVYISEQGPWVTTEKQQSVVTI